MTQQFVDGGHFEAECACVIPPVESGTTEVLLSLVCAKLEDRPSFRGQDLNDSWLVQFAVPLLLKAFPTIFHNNGCARLGIWNRLRLPDSRPGVQQLPAQDQVEDATGLPASSTEEVSLHPRGAMDQWEWELRVIDLQDGADGDKRRYVWVAEDRAAA